MYRLAAVVLLGLGPLGCTHHGGASGGGGADVQGAVAAQEREALMRSRLRENDLRLTRLSRIELQVQDQITLLVEPLDDLGHVLSALRTVSDRYDVPERLVEAAVETALEDGKIRVPEATAPQARARLRPLLAELTRADEAVDAVLRNVSATRATLEALGEQADRLRREIDEVAAKAEADEDLAPDIRRSARGDQHQAERLHRAVEDRLDQALDTLEGVPQRAETLRWHLQHPFDASRLPALTEAS